MHPMSSPPPARLAAGLIALSLAVLALGACDRRSAAEPERAEAPAKALHGRIAQFQAIDQQVGTGAVLQPGNEAIVHYTGWFYDDRAADQRGSKFDSSYDHNGRPFSFLVGAGRVIRGWDEGVVGMRVGGKRRLMVPPELGYGAQGAGGGVIPPDASLVFEVELLGVEPR